jgi:metal-sulfur cluster biosynthetic enzyme
MSEPGDGNATAAPTVASHYAGPPLMRETLLAALERVIDPELAVDIVALGLVERIEVDAQRVAVTLLMTSPMCPVVGVMAEDAENALRAVVEPTVAVEVSVVEEPAWGPERMSPRARLQLGWE